MFSKKNTSTTAPQDKKILMPQEEQNKRIYDEMRVLKQLNAEKFYLFTAGIPAKDGDCFVTGWIKSQTFFSKFAFEEMAIEQLKKQNPKTKVTGIPYIVYLEEITREQYLQFILNKV